MQTELNSMLKILYIIINKIYSWDAKIIQHMQVSNLAYHLNKMKGKSHIKSSTDVEKGFDKIQHPFMIKTFTIMSIEGKYFNIIQFLYDKSTGNIIFNDEKLKI